MPIEATGFLRLALAVTDGTRLYPIQFQPFFQDPSDGRFRQRDSFAPQQDPETLLAHEQMFPAHPPHSPFLFSGPATFPRSAVIEWLGSIRCSTFQSAPDRSERQQPDSDLGSSFSVGVSRWRSIQSTCASQRARKQRKLTSQASVLHGQEKGVFTLSSLPTSNMKMIEFLLGRNVKKDQKIQNNSCCSDLLKTCFYKPKSKDNPQKN